MKIAIIGTGISGLAAAHLLHRIHDVDIFEKDDRVGGHSHTVLVEGGEAPVPVDTGFIVYNERTYPLLTKLLARLRVPTQPSDMSFSVSCGRCGIEYASHPSGMMAAPRNWASPSHWRMIGEILRFFREAPRVLDDESGPDRTLGEWLRGRRYSETFRRHFLAPLGGAVWSTSPERMSEYPVRMFVRFFRNHGFLGIGTSPPWRTVTGGSREYVRRLTAGFADRIRLETPVRRLRREAGGVELEEDGGRRHAYDAVIVATHSDQALAMLADPDDGERRMLGAIPYTGNETILHTDDRVLPRHRGARASWNIRLDDCRAPDPRLVMTYDLSRLQSIPSPRTYCVSLNAGAAIDPARVIRRLAYEHPFYTPAAVPAQREWAGTLGRRNTWFCGAWTRYGFHEDGLMSGVAVAERLGGRL